MPRRWTADHRRADDWDAPVPGTGGRVFTGIAGSLSRRLPQRLTLRGYARSNVQRSDRRRVLRRHPATGAIEINAKRRRQLAGEIRRWFVSAHRSMLERL